ncbi:MAG: phosphoglucosamine mutase [Candidatus Puniceispirillales bacterium]
MNIFGTDGVRGKVNEWPMTAELVQKLAISAGSIYLGKGGSNLNRVVIGKDTRLSGYMLEPALVSGFTSMGMDCLTLGPIPTPGVSRLTRSFRADLGVMISASHNPSEDNGIKLFGPDGLKLSDNMENQISKLINKNIKLANPNSLGRVKRLEDAVGRYIEAVKSCINKEQRLEGIKVVVDCANGAAYKAAPQALFELGAEVIPIAIEPDGFNINKDCGAVYPNKMSKEVVAHKADIGIAFDGDADRLIMSDEKGNIVDGDQLLAILAIKMQRDGLLKNSTIVGTTMTNHAFDLWLNNIGIKLMRADVGDRYISEAISQFNFSLGGEPSGHILIPHLSKTGDALMNALIILCEFVKEKKLSSKFFNKFNSIPQIIYNIKGYGNNILENDEIKSKLTTIIQSVQNEARIIVRPSGTEKIIRIMVESNNKELIKTTISKVESLLMNY